MGRKIEMTWTCSACGTENLGRHKVCPQCGDPKDASEKFTMPKDTRAAATVTDPELLKKARAGADWRCERCGSNQGALLSECTQCGAARPDGPKPKQKGKRPAPAARSTPLTTVIGAVVTALVGLGALVFFGPAILVLLFAPGPPPPPPPIDVAVKVVGHHWERGIRVERYAIRPQEGFAEATPGDAMDVQKAGRRHHHDEQVLDHMGTETYTVEVPDGYDTVYDSVQVQCGEDCTTTPETCSESCTSDDNGFASCTTTCSGGGQSCSPRYCTEQQARQVARTRTETRTREVPVYRTESRDADWYTWKAWTWATDRRFDLERDDRTPVWPPDEEVKLGVGLADGEQERADRSESYTVTVGVSNKVHWEKAIADEASWLALTHGSVHVARLSTDLGTVLELDPPVAVEAAAP